MDAAGRRIDLAHQRIGVSALELSELAPVEDARRQIMRQRELLEHGSIGAIGAGLALAPARQSQLVEQHFAELLGRADVEGMAGETVDLALQLDKARAEILREPVELAAVDADAGALHGRDDADQRPLDGLIEGEAPLAEQTRLERAMETQRDVGLLRRVIARAVERRGGQSDMALATPGDVLVLDRGMAEMPARQLVDVMAVRAAF